VLVEHGHLVHLGRLEQHVLLVVVADHGDVVVAPDEKVIREREDIEVFNGRDEGDHPQFLHGVVVLLLDVGVVVAEHLEVVVGPEEEAFNVHLQVGLHPQIDGVVGILLELGHKDLLLLPHLEQLARGVYADEVHLLCVLDFTH